MDDIIISATTNGGGGAGDLYVNNPWPTQPIPEGWEWMTNIEAGKLVDGVRSPFLLSSITAWHLDDDHGKTWAAATKGTVFTAYDPEHTGNYSDVLPIGDYILVVQTTQWSTPLSIPITVAPAIHGGSAVGPQQLNKLQLEWVKTHAKH